MAYKSIPDMFIQACAKGGDRRALRAKVAGRWESMSWRQSEDTVMTLAKALCVLGMQPGDRVAILSNTRREWVLADLAILSGAGVTVPIYQSNLAKECEFALVDSESRFVFVEDEKQLAKIHEIRAALPKLVKIILMSGHRPSGTDTLTFDDLLILGKKQPDDEIQKRIAQIELDSLASIVYTSGTTGSPKGAMLTHGGFLFVTASASGLLKPTAADETLLFLPLAHIFARIIEFICLYEGVTISFAESIEKLLVNVEDVRPTFMASVPRIYEKVYASVLSDAAALRGFKRALFNFSLSAGRDFSRHVQKKEALPPLDKLRYAIADRAVYSKVRARFGGRIRFFVSGGAPLSKEVAEFFHASGLLILEGYGLTETTAVTNVNRPEGFKFGTVGQPIPGVEQKIAPDGEVLSRSAGIMKGYFNRPEETAEVIDSEGWYRTGDIGEFDDDGYLRITDRKKDIIVTAGGKNIAPQNVENHLKSSPLISQAMVYGDKRKYLSALLTLNIDEVVKYAQTHDVAFGDVRELSTHPVVMKKIDQVVAEKNKDLASYETIKKFAILPDDFSQEKGELTPTLKVKRKVVSQKYKAILDGFYDEKLYD